MTSILNNSNSNSSLINTLSASESAMNPNVYSTQPIYYPAATTYVRTDISSGVVGASKTITFNLLKYGICQQILLCYTKNFTDATGKLYQNDLWNIIERVELLSSSKVIATLTNNDLMAQFSDLETAQYAPIADSALDARTTAAQEHLFVVPLVWGFCQRIGTNLNLQFNEPMSIRVKFGPTLDEKSAGTIASPAISDVFLKMRYKAYNEKDFAQVVAENYEKPELNILSSSFYDESSSTATYAAAAAAATGRTLKVELKNTDCVNDFYIYVRRISGENYVSGTNGQPVELTKLVMTASGQEIFNLSSREQAYSRLCENGFSIASSTSGTTGFENPWMRNVVKIQTGLWHYSGNDALSNTMSLRELNNPIIEATFDTPLIGAQDEVYEMVVVENCSKIFSCTSANGRLNVALSN